MRYPCGNPSITELEISYVLGTLRAGRITQGMSVRRFEEVLAEFLNVDHVVVCSSGTSAIHLALAALGIGPGDEVLVPDLTYVATLNAVKYVGATPVLVDVEPDTWTIDAEQACAKITTRTKAIIPVHLYGVPCNMEEIHALADVHNLHIVEDAAEGLGGSIGGHALGTLGACGIFSFYANKIITTGEGGAIATNDPEIADVARLLRGQAVSPTRRFWHAEVGYNYRMTDMQAAIGIAQMSRLKKFIVERQRVVDGYRDSLGDVMELPVRDSAPWMFTALLPTGVPVHRVEEALAGRGIEIRPLFVPMHRLPMFTAPEHEFPCASMLESRGISLPTYPELTNEDVSFIANSLKEVIA
jgi:perosamine synthetase